MLAKPLLPLSSIEKLYLGISNCYFIYFGHIYVKKYLYHQIFRLISHKLSPYIIEHLKNSNLQFQIDCAYIFMDALSNGDVVEA